MPRFHGDPAKAEHSLVVELVDLQHVSEDHELLVHDAGRDLLHAAGHLPQVGLPEETEGSDEQRSKVSRNRYFRLCKRVPGVNAYLKIYLKDEAFYKTT